MNNSAWQSARAKAGLDDLHVHDLRHTVGLRLREAGVSEATVAEVLWHKSKTMTQHYSMATIDEIHAALEKVTDERNRGNISIESLIRKAAAKRKSPNGGLS
jgi:integrase